MSFNQSTSGQDGPTIKLNWPVWSWMESHSEISNCFARARRNELFARATWGDWRVKPVGFGLTVSCRAYLWRVGYWGRAFLSECLYGTSNATHE